MLYSYLSSCVNQKLFHIVDHFPFTHTLSNKKNVQIHIGRNKRGTTKIPSAYTDDTSFLTRIHDLASNLRPNNSKTRSKRFHNNLHLPLSLFRKITFVLLLFFVYVNYYIHFLKTCKIKMKLFYIYLQIINYHSSCNHLQISIT